MGSFLTDADNLARWDAQLQRQRERAARILRAVGLLPCDRRDLERLIERQRRVAEEISAVRAALSPYQSTHHEGSEP